MPKTVLFQIIQFILKTQISSVLPINKIPSGATILGQSGPESDGNEGLLRIPQSTSITRTSPSDCIVSYPEDMLVGVTPQQRIWVLKRIVII